MSRSQIRGAITTTGTGAVGVDVQTLGGDGGAGALGSGAGAVGGFGGRGGHSGAIDVEVLTTGTVTHVGRQCRRDLCRFPRWHGWTRWQRSGADRLSRRRWFGRRRRARDCQQCRHAHTTSGQFAYGIYAFSLGGKGGGSGTAGGAITFGGGSGSGSHGGDVSVSNSGTINTSGKGSYAIFAQSLGGAGGDAGANTASSAIGATARRPSRRPALPIHCSATTRHGHRRQQRHDQHQLHARCRRP